ncbi:hypothetical protein BBJ28_00006191 [Nothophytophthora sp. Chile5]|nr:hypothetical protein BBJ28_00006191 [Nothophytophthora sp. Chile5]
MMNAFFVRSLGFFIASYDLMIMNVVNILLSEQYGSSVYTSSMKSAVSAAALIGAGVGQMLFGVLGDTFGRRPNMIASCVLLIVGSAFCACAYGGSPQGTLWVLVAARGLLGIGVGGEYPLSASATAEDSPTTEIRSHRVALNFALQGVGSQTASLLGMVLIWALANEDKGKNDPTRLEIVWRLLLGVGMLPACFLLYYRLRAKETVPFKAAQKRRIEAERCGLKGSASLGFVLKNYYSALLGTAGTWFLFDIAFYAQNMFSATLLTVIGVSDTTSLRVASTENAFVALLALPGYYVAVFFINTLGRRRIQMQGFAFMTVLFLCLATLWDDLGNNAVAFILLYGLALFFANFGPNMSTFVLPTEMYPTPIRCTCFGFSAACGKAGAAIGSLGFGIWASDEGFGYASAFFVFAGITLLAMPLTWFFLQDSELTVAEIDDEFFELLNDDDDASSLGPSAMEDFTFGVTPNGVSGRFVAMLANQKTSGPQRRAVAPYF